MDRRTFTAFLSVKSKKYIDFSGNPDSFKDSETSLNRAKLVSIQSLPPLITKPFPDFIAKEAISITTFGLLSKITPKTPKGTLTFSTLSSFSLIFESITSKTESFRLETVNNESTIL